MLEKITDIHIQIYDNYLGAVGKYIQVVAVSDDLGAQDQALMSPALYREMVKPVHERLWGFIKKKTDAHLFLHSCGSICAFIPDWIELGVDIINPVQVSAKDMDSHKLKREFGADITFWGGIDTHRVMPMGSPDEVEEEVIRRIKDLAPGADMFLPPPTISRPTLIQKTCAECTHRQKSLEIIQLDYKMGKKAAQLLLENENNNKKCIFETELMKRGSTARKY